MASTHLRNASTGDRHDPLSQVGCARSHPAGHRCPGQHCFRFEPPRSAVHHHGAQGRWHRLLHVHELRSRPRRLRHRDRQLPAAAGGVRRPELLQDGSERALRDPPRQQRRRQGRPHLPVPLPEQVQQHLAADRRQERVDPADAGRLGQRAQRGHAQRQRNLHRRCHARRPPRRPARLGDQRRRRQQDLRQAGGQHRHQDHPELRRLRRPAHLHRQRARLQHAGQALRRPAQGSLRGQPRHDLRPGQRTGVRDHRSGADQCGAEHHRRRQRHHAGASKCTRAA